MGEHYEDFLNNEVDRLLLEKADLVMNKKQLEVAYSELEEKYSRIHMLVSQILFDKGAFPFICGTMGDLVEWLTEINQNQMNTERKFLIL